MMVTDSQRTGDGCSTQKQTKPSSRLPLLATARLVAVFSAKDHHCPLTGSTHAYVNELFRVNLTVKYG